MKNLKDKVAAITGAASGIGRNLAVQLAMEGCHLALSDIDEAGLKETKRLVGDSVRVSTHHVDVARQEQVIQFAKEAAEQHGGVDIIINNAGVSLGDFLETVPIEDFQWLMGINFWGVVYGTMAFLPYLRKRPEGHVINISSINGILSNPNNGPYCAAKFAVKGYTETLYQELLDTNIRVSCVHPGGIKTQIARNARVNKTLYDVPKEKAVLLFEKELFITTAQMAAQIIVEGIKGNRRRIMVGRDAKVIDLLTRWFPKTMVWLSAVQTRRLVKKYASPPLPGGLEA
ncbi:MAG: SDR family NAD(P)-dependent oxidoreductase [Desulfobacterales bacterium]|nr:SDR family NAD(P)-dependent oxidoreductase [Desulfobacterales bacterium]